MSISPFVEPKNQKGQLLLVPLNYMCIQLQERDSSISLFNAILVLCGVKLVSILSEHCLGLSNKPIATIMNLAHELQWTPFCVMT